MELKEFAENTTLTSTRARTRRLLIGTAMKLFDSGAFPSITEVAQEAQVSRATAYRYFPTQSLLVEAVVSETLSPIHQWQPSSSEASARIDELLSYAFPQMLAHEGTLRASLYLSLIQWAQTRSYHAIPMKERLVRGNRKTMLRQVVHPLHKELPAEHVERVVQALSLVYSSEIFLVMKDIWGFDDRQVEEIGKWIAKAIVRQAREDATTTEH